MLQVELAERAELDQRRISMIEGAKANPTLKTMVILAAALDKDLPDLLIEQTLAARR
jgi:transcriptional regulator with XRE-family HTH domain